MFKYADYIYKIYQEQSFTQAAKKLFVSQPALSATVKKAEEELGFKIFNRETAPVTLTDLGQVYITAIEQMHRLERNLRDNINDINALVVGEISVGGATSVSSFVLPKIIMEFSRRYPKIDINLIESNSINLQEKVLSEEIEILVDYDFDSEDFEAYALKKEHILLAVPQHHPINHRLGEFALGTQDIIASRHLKQETPGIDLGLLKDEQFIMLKPKNNMHTCSVRICGDYGFAPQPSISVDQLVTAYNIAGTGMGITFTTDTMIQSAAQYETLKFYKLNSDYAERTLYIARKRKKYKSPAVSEFIKVAQEIYPR